MHNKPFSHINRTALIIVSILLLIAGIYTWTIIQTKHSKKVLQTTAKELNVPTGCQISSQDSHAAVAMGPPATYNIHYNCSDTTIAAAHAELVSNLERNHYEPSDDNSINSFTYDKSGASVAYEFNFQDRSPPLRTIDVSITYGN